MSRNIVASVTACFGVAVILSGLYRYFMEPGGTSGLWFGLVMGALALLASLLQMTRISVVGDLLALVVALFVGGWFCYENFGKAKHELRMYLMIVVSAAELAVLVVSRVRRKKAVGSPPHLDE